MIFIPGSPFGPVGPVGPICSFVSTLVDSILYILSPCVTKIWNFAPGSIWSGSICGIFDIIIKDDKFFEENDDVILINEDNYMISIDEENEDNIIVSGRGEYNGTKW